MTAAQGSAVYFFTGILKIIKSYSKTNATKPEILHIGHPVAFHWYT
ncbi:hypothetical protein NOC27_160 [Nitrosococcus oceani AFC27]|nr:hypothetical protein NOC27_160 [Nitrosococcus oceani AFC27]